MQIKLPKGIFRKGAIVGAAAATAVLALSASLRLAVPVRASDVAPMQLAQFPNVNGNCNNYGSNLGTINNNCNNTTINQAPAPTVQILETVDQRRGDGTYGKNIHIRVVSPYPAKKLVVGVRSPDVTSVDIVPAGGGVMFNIARGPCGEECLGVQIGGPVIGDYRVYVNTKENENVSLLWNVE